MKVLLTGALGNIGKSTIKELLKQGYSVRCFDLQTKSNLKFVKKYGHNLEVFWGNITKMEDVVKAIEGCDAVIHLASIIPPLSENNQQLSYQVNVVGTENLLKVIGKRKLVFTSSIAVFGEPEQPFWDVTDPVISTDNYSKQKIECEKMIENSIIDWVILRLSMVPSLDLKIDTLMFKIPLEARLEYLDRRDCALAIVNSLHKSKKKYLIGGGVKCQMFYDHFLKKMFKTMGMKMYPADCFSKKEYYINWLNTKESQEELKYQRYIFDDYLKIIKKKIGWKKILIKIFEKRIKNKIK